MYRLATYTLCFSFPFNKVTSLEYSEDKNLKDANVEETIRAIELVISSHGFISLEMVMKLFGLRPTRHCPGINFVALEDAEIVYDEINHTDVIRLYLVNELQLRRVLRKTDNTYEEEYIIPIEENKEPEKTEEKLVWRRQNMDLIKNSDGIKETSESEENEKT